MCVSKTHKLLIWFCLCLFIISFNSYLFFLIVNKKEYIKFVGLSSLKTDIYVYMNVDCFSARIEQLISTLLLREDVPDRADCHEK